LAVAAGVGVLALTAGCVAVSWSHDSKLVPRHGGHPVGAALWSWLFLGFACAAFVLYLGGLWLLRRGGGMRLVLALALAVQVAPLAAPLLVSTDAWTYWDYGRIAAVYDANPYRQPPSHFPDDPAYPYVGVAWRGTTTVYGPAFTLASEPLVRVAGTSADAAA